VERPVIDGVRKFSVFVLRITQNTHMQCAAKYRVFYGSTCIWARTSDIRRLTNFIRCVPSCQPHAYWVGSQEMCRQNVQQFEGSYTVLFTFSYIKLYAHIQNCW